MIQKPLTYVFDYTHMDEVLRPYIMHLLADAGAKHLVLSDGLMGMILKDATLTARLVSEASAEGLDFVDSHALFGTFYDLQTIDDTTRNHVILLDKLQIAIAAEMGIRTITMHPGSDTISPEYPLEKRIENVMYVLDKILPVAESFGVTVCIENSWSRLSRPNNLVNIKDKFPTDALGFCYDAGHANVLSSNAKQYEKCAARDRWSLFGLEPEWEDHAIEKMLPHIVNCHLHDNDASADQHRLPGDGNVDWPHVMQCLAKAPRLDCIQCEVGAIKHRISFPALCRKFDELMTMA